MSLATNIQDAFLRAATQDKLILTLLTGNASNLSGLNTTTKTNLVAALNEVLAAVASASGIDDATTSSSSSWSSTKTQAEIDDAISAAAVDLTDLIDDVTPSTSTVYSSANVAALILSARDTLLGGAGPAYDTLGELGELLSDNEDAVAAINTALGNRLRYDAPQTLSGPQQVQARANIGAANAAGVGDTATDFVAIFEAGLA